MLVIAGGILSACSDDDTSGNPAIRYIRVTRPASSDSLIVSAGQGQMIAIMGTNLRSVRELWFNDLPAVLNPAFITDNTIITRVPSEIPSANTNTLKMVFANGETLDYDFSVDISEPRIDRMKSEYVNVGEEAIIYGDYFYEPLTVTFAGGVQGEIVSIEDTEVHIKVPDGAQPGPVTVATGFGETESNFWFRDNRNIIASFDGTTTGMWHGPAFIKESDNDISPINGKFLRIDQVMAAWGWFEMYVGPSDSDAALELKNIPLDAFTNPEGYSLKFEINTQEPLTGAHLRMYIGPDMAGQRGTTYYNWQPNLNTEGAWETISIPWVDVYEANDRFVYNPDGYGTSMHFSGPNAFTAKFGLDNMRVVPNTPE